MKITVAEIAKAITCLVTLLAGAVAQGIIVGKVAAVVTLVIGVLATAGVYTAPNTPHGDSAT